MAGLLNLVNEWLVRGLVLLSLAAHILLITFAGIRRHKASSRRRAILWLAYQLADWVATFSIGQLFLGSTSREQQLVAFWLPFLLIHLGRPDNICAYSLEDNALSGCPVVEAVTQVVGAGYVLYNHIIIGGSGGGTFLAASVIMFFVGIIKYLERVAALWLADLGSIRSSRKKHKLFLPGDLEREIPLPRSLERGGDSEQALLAAHDLFHITEGAFADYSSVDEDAREAWPYGWEKMCKVVEMELSIMYDILYTKAAVIHTGFGYGIRAAWPFFTLTAFLLFWFCGKDGLRRADIYITYILLAATFLLDIRWLLRALGSTWTYAFLNDRPQSWLPYILCTGRRHQVRLVLVKERSSYRMWSGRIGQYNLLHECTHETTSLLRTLAKNLGLEDSWKDYQYHHSRGLDIPPCVRELLFERIWVKLKLAYGVRKKVTLKIAAAEQLAARPPPPPADAAARKRKRLDEALGFDPEVQEDILVLHIATDVFLLRRGQNAASCEYVKAIEALSNYMLFLVAVRPYMLPGLKLSSLHKATSDALQGIWHDHEVEGKKTHNPCSREREYQLAGILQNMESENSRHLNYRPGDDDDKRSLLYDSSIILSDGTRYAEVLLRWEKSMERSENSDMDKILEEVGIEGISEERPENREMDKILEEVGIRGISEERPENPEMDKILEQVGIGGISEERPENPEMDKILEEVGIEGISEERSENREMDKILEEVGIGGISKERLKSLIPKLWTSENVANTQIPLMEIIFDAWVRMLIYVSIRCSRESHAKQLSRGSELTTIVWILTEHAGVLGIHKNTGRPTE